MNGRRRATTRSAWSNHAEAATLALDAARNKTAQQAFRALNVVDQSRLAFEVARTHRRELCLAYRNVVMVTSGRKQTSSRKTGRSRLGRLPCVIFVVRKKWAGKTPRGTEATQMLPHYLMAYWTVDGERVMCAVPTDVVIDRQFLGVKAESPSGVKADGGGAPFAILGNITCSARVRQLNGTETSVVLGCQHVLSPAPNVNTGPRAGATVTALGSGAIGRTLRSGGTLYWDNNSPDVASSFDVQLAGIAQINAAMAALGGYRLSAQRPFLNSAEFYKLAYGEDAGSPATFLVMVPAANGGTRRVEAEYAGEHPHQAALEYEVTVNGTVQTVLIHPKTAISLQFTKGSTQEGDSGSPVVIQAADGRYTLAGMHIGRSAEGRSVMVPAWQLFNGEWYTPKLASIRPVNL